MQMQNICHFADDILKCIFLNKNVWILIEITSFVPKGAVDQTMNVASDRGLALNWHQAIINNDLAYSLGLSDLTWVLGRYPNYIEITPVVFLLVNATVSLVTIIACLLA